MHEIRVAIVGAGRIAGAHLQALQSIEEAEVIAVADIDREPVREFAAAADCRAYTDFEEMIDRETPEIVCVCTPPISHPEVAIYALRSGAHVLCEKPFAIDTISAKRMVETAQQCGRYLTMASKFRFVEDVRKTKELVEAGLLGKVVLCEIAFCGRVDMRDRWPSNPRFSGGGVLIDNGSHAV